jgi:hypothetical protein
LCVYLGGGGGGAGLGGAVFVRAGGFLDILGASFVGSSSSGGGGGASSDAQHNGGAGKGKGGAIFVSPGARAGQCSGSIVFDGNAASDQGGIAGFLSADDDDLYGSLPGLADANGDGNVDVGDVFSLINSLFAGGDPLGSSCRDDVNGDGLFDVADVFYLINYLFANGPAPI